jgi:nucleotide-binding universal stress UspA family protein
MNVQHILVPVDFSEFTGDTLKTATDLAQKFTARVTLCHFLEPVFPPATELAFAFDKHNREIQDEAEKQIRVLADSFPAGIQTETRVETGIPWNGIVELAEKLRVDLIVMPTHGRSGLKHLWLGSVAERVVQHAPCAVFVVRQSPGAAPTHDQGL